MPIRILPPEIASQIAAGEVIERPASVVKELLENALDSGARYITIKTEGAGQRLIEVADDGSGIPAEELPLAVERHATSKLTSAADLFHINTLGFRGEALASIGSVARMTITSRCATAPADADLGARLRVQGGQVSALQPVGAPIGTIVRVEDLFYNLPARLKFLKHDTTERRQIDALVTRYALAYPQVRFQLTQEGSMALQTSGNGEQREVLAALYGADVARQMLAVLYSESELNLHGFISPVSLTRANRREMIFFVNGRPVQDSALSAAVLKGYHTLLMVGRYPIAVLFVGIPPESVDVNVHPTKAEVRFRESDRIFSGIQNGIRRALMAHNPVSQIDQQLRWRPEIAQTQPSRAIDPTWRWSEEAQKPITPPAEQQRGEASAQGALPAERTPLLRLVGQIANTYLVAEGPDGLYLIDQHAAHERVLFERFMAQRSAKIVSQSLLQPATVELPAASARLLSTQLEILAKLGFQVEAFGLNTFLVRTIPSLLADSDAAAAIRVLVEDFEEDETPLQAETEARLVARICKRAAVKAGKNLSSEEQRALLQNLENCQSPRTCPHGRPTMIHLSVDLLERQFGRRGRVDRFTQRKRKMSEMHAVWLENQELHLRRDIPIPTPAEGDALIEVRLAGICATDLELTRGYYPYTGIPGHEFVGQVVKAPGNISWVGQRVVGEINITCGKCRQCQAGRSSHCEQGSTLGIRGHHGAFAEFLTLPVSNLHRVPDSVSDEAAVFTEPLAAALEIQQQISIQPENRVLLVGAGRLGQLIAQSLALTGCELNVVVRHPLHQQLLAQCGINTLIEEEVGVKLWDVVIEATGSTSGFNLSRQAVRPRGTIILKSTFVGNNEINLSAIVVNEIQIIGSRCGPFAPALRLLQHNLIQPERLISARYPLADALTAFQHTKQPGVLKILLDIPGNTA